MPKPKDAPRFTGFPTPYFTQIPNGVFDDLLADLSGAEWKVLGYLMRKTYGWQKDTDNIGLKQLTDGIPGTDRGTGLSKSTVAVALKSLEDWGLIEREQNQDAKGGDLPTTYRVRLSDTGSSKNRTPQTSIIGHPRVLGSDTQKINPQNKTQKNGVHPEIAIGTTMADPSVINVDSAKVDRSVPNVTKEITTEETDDQFAVRNGTARGYGKAVALGIAAQHTRDGVLNRGAFLDAIPRR